MEFQRLGRPASSTRIGLARVGPLEQPRPAGCRLSRTSWTASAARGPGNRPRAGSGPAHAERRSASAAATRTAASARHGTSPVVLRRNSAARAGTPHRGGGLLRPARPAGALVLEQALEHADRRVERRHRARSVSQFQPPSSAARRAAGDETVDVRRRSRRRSQGSAVDARLHLAVEERLASCSHRACSATRGVVSRAVCTPGRPKSRSTLSTGSVEVHGWRARSPARAGFQSSTTSAGNRRRRPTDRRGPAGRAAGLPIPPSRHGHAPRRLRPGAGEVPHRLPADRRVALSSQSVTSMAAIFIRATPVVDTQTR